MNSELIKALQMMAGMFTALIITIILMIILITLFPINPEKEKQRKENLEKAKKEFKNAVLESWPVPQIIDLFFRITGRYNKGVLGFIRKGDSNNFVEVNSNITPENFNNILMSSAGIHPVIENVQTAFGWLREVQVNKQEMVIHLRNKATLKKFIMIFSIKEVGSDVPLEIPVAYNSSVPRGEVWIINKTKQTIRKIIL